MYFFLLNESHSLSHIFARSKVKYLPPNGFRGHPMLKENGTKRYKKEKVHFKRLTVCDGQLPVNYMWGKNITGTKNLNINLKLTNKFSTDIRLFTTSAAVWVQNLQKLRVLFIDDCNEYLSRGWCQFHACESTTPHHT